MIGIDILPKGAQRPRLDSVILVDLSQQAATVLTHVSLEFIRSLVAIMAGAISERNSNRFYDRPRANVMHLREGNRTTPISVSRPRREHPRGYHPTALHHLYQPKLLLRRTGWPGRPASKPIKPRRSATNSMAFSSSSCAVSRPPETAR